MWFPVVPGKGWGGLSSQRVQSVLTDEAVSEDVASLWVNLH